MLNVATRGLLYEFRVGGKVADPQIKAVPTPVLSEARALIFGRMLRETEESPRLEESVPHREKDAPPSQ